MVSWNMVVIGSGIGLLPDSAKPLYEPVLMSWSILPEDNIAKNTQYIDPWYELENY